MSDLINSQKQNASASIRKDIQGLRALAVVLVILFHLGLPVPGGFIGVDIFFVISGYVITAMLEREWVGSGRIDVRRFFVRRFWRLTPALATVVVTTMILGAAILSALGPQRLMSLTGLAAMCLSANAVIAKFTGGYFDLAADTNPLLNTWSLSVEEQFYIGFLLVLIIGWSAGKFFKFPIATIRILVASTFIISFSVAMLAQPGQALDTPNWIFHFYSPINRAWEFAAGSFLALFGSQVEKLPRKIKNFSGLLGIALVFYCALSISESKAFVRVMLVLVISVVLTGVTFRWIETPFRHQRQSKKLKSGILAIGIFAMPMVCAFAVYEANNNYFWNENVRSQAIALADIHVADKNECDTKVSNLHKSYAKCSWNLGGPGEPIYLVGDSNAAHFSDGLIAAAKRTGHPLITAIGAGCPILFVPYVQPSRGTAVSRKYSKCSRFSQETFTWLKTQPRGLVLVSNTDYYVNIPKFRVVSSGTSNTYSGNQYFELLTDSLSKLNNAGFKAALISGPIHFDPRMQNFPAQYKWQPSRCTLVSEILKRCAVSMPIDAVQKYQGNYWHSLKEAASSSDSSFIDLSLVFCSKTHCPTQTRDLQIYRDAGHITVQADMTLVPRFVRELNNIFKVK